MHPITVEKEELKKLAKEIRELKSQRKEKDLNYDIWYASRRFRHEHIAYCLVRGRTYEQIEQPSQFNKPNFDIINKHKNELQEKVDKHNKKWLELHPLFVRVANE